MKTLSVLKKLRLKSSALLLVTVMVLKLDSKSSAQTTATTDPVGFVSITVPAQTDYALGIPLHPPSVYQGQIASISGNQITLAGSPNWTANQFVYASGAQNNTYYVLIDSGASEGLFAQITGNDSSSITVTLSNGDTLSNVLTNSSNVNGGDLISIIPYWTPGTLIVGAPAGTQLLLFPTSTAGINLSASTIYGFNGTNWKKGLTVADNAILPPLQGMVLRNNGTSAVSFSITGSVPMTTHRQLFSTLAANTQQDIWFFFNSPVPEIIGNLNLGAAAGDQLLVFDNTASGFNKSASQILGWTGSAWKKGLANVTTTFSLTPGYSYVLRKASSATPVTTIWSALQSYLTATPTP